MEGAKGRAGEGGVGGGQCFDERLAGEGAVLVRHAVLALERAAEELQAVVPPDLVLVRRREHPRQVGHDAVGQFWQGKEFVRGGVLLSGRGSRILGNERPFRFHHSPPFLHRVDNIRNVIHYRRVRSGHPNSIMLDIGPARNRTNMSFVYSCFRHCLHRKNEIAKIG